MVVLLHRQGQQVKAIYNEGCGRPFRCGVDVVRLLCKLDEVLALLGLQELGENCHPRLRPVVEALDVSLNNISKAMRYLYRRSHLWGLKLPHNVKCGIKLELRVVFAVACLVGFNKLSFLALFFGLPFDL